MAKKITDTVAQPSLNGTARKLRRNVPSITLLLIGFIVGILWFGSLRYFLAHENEVHYHSNFAVFIDGRREEFKSFTYYEEVAACTAAFANNPKGRVHMHDQVNDVIHIHDNAVTYSDFFRNIDWTVGPDFVRTADGLLESNDSKAWVFVLNGEKVDRIDNLSIGDQDTLLLSYGSPDSDVNSQYITIKNNAAQLDKEQDPASCSGANGPLDNSFMGRIKKAFSFTE